MSGIEIIGLILGGLPLIISAAEDYKRGFEPFLKWHRYKREFRGFVNSVDLEKQMLDGLLSQLLKYTDLPLDLKQVLLAGNDPEAWSREETVNALKFRLGDSYISCMYILETMKEDMIRLQNMMSLKDGSVDWAKPGEDKWNYQRKRIAHSFSKKGVESVASLERNNRKFRELLDLLDRKLVDGKLNHSKAVTKDTTWAKVFECIRQHASSLHTVLRNGWRCNCVVPHLANLQLQERDRGNSPSFAFIFASPRLAKTSNPIQKVVITVREPQASQHLAHPRPQATPVQGWYLDNLRVNLESKSSPEVTTVSLLSSNSSLNSSFMSSKYSSNASFTPSDSLTTLSSVSSSSGIETLVEESFHRNWSIVRKSKPQKIVRMNVPAEPEKPSISSFNTNTVAEIPHDCSSSQTKESVQTADVKIEDLCSTLEASGGTDSNLGYLSDSEHNHHDIRSIRDNTVPTKTSGLISLEGLLSNDNRMKLTRKQRFRLALVLASSMLQLQTTPWLTGPLDKEQIFFYRNGSEILANEPYIRHSFPSNKSIPKTSTDDKPNQHDNPFATRSFTRRSLVQLGILLLELCFGQSIETQTDIRSQYLMDGKAHNDTDYLTARDWIYEVGEEAGEEFENAVKSCVLCNFDAKLNWADTNFTQSVYAGVVQPLEKAMADLGW